MKRTRVRRELPPTTPPMSRVKSESPQLVDGGLPAPDVTPPPIKGFISFSTLPPILNWVEADGGLALAIPASGSAVAPWPAKDATTDGGLALPPVEEDEEDEDDARCADADGGLALEKSDIVKSI